MMTYNLAIYFMCISFLSDACCRDIELVSFIRGHTGNTAMHM